MTSVFHIAKIVCAVVGCVAATVAIFLRPELVVPLAVLSLAWSHVPE